MQLFALLLAATGVALATVPTLSSYSAAGCTGTALATWTGVAENAFCEATPGAIALNVTPGGSSEHCEIDLYTTSNCDGTTGGFITTVPDAAGCFNATETFSSVRIVCITGG